jgi:hypothetical protein
MRDDVLMHADDVALTHADDVLTDADDVAQNYVSHRADDQREFAQQYWASLRQPRKKRSPNRDGIRRYLTIELRLDKILRSSQTRHDRAERDPSGDFVEWFLVGIIIVVMRIDFWFKRHFF